MNVHFFSEYNGYVVLSYTHLPENKLQLSSEFFSATAVGSSDQVFAFFAVREMARMTIKAMNMETKELNRFLRLHFLGENWHFLAISPSHSSHRGGFFLFGLIMGGDSNNWINLFGVHN